MSSVRSIAHLQHPAGSLPAPVNVHLRTYGCQMNVLDSQIVAGMLVAHGFTVVEDAEAADAVLFNTCSVRDVSERKVLGKLGELRIARARRPELVLGVLGCMAELSGPRLLEKNPHVDFACGTNARSRIPALLRDAFVRRVAGAKTTRHNARHLDRLRTAFGNAVDAGGTRIATGTGVPEALDERVAIRPHPWHAFVEIMRGCSNYCSYCVVPYARGAETSRPHGDILDEISRLAAAGVMEVTLLGQNVNSYGRGGARGELSFPDLLRRINAIAGIRWIRFVTSNPQDISDELVAAIAECAKVCNQIHFPLQSGSDRILKLMNRKYTRAGYFQTVDKLRSAVPGMAFSSDFIVGFPGETDKDFALTRMAMEEVRYTSSFLFKYSPRPGTAAAALSDDVPCEVKKARHQELLALQNVLTLEVHQAQIGTEQEVLVEGPSKRNAQTLQGRTARYFNVVLPGDPAWAGTFRRVVFDRATTLTLYGKDTETPKT